MFSSTENRTVSGWLLMPTGGGGSYKWHKAQTVQNLNKQITSINFFAPPNVTAGAFFYFFSNRRYTFYSYGEFKNILPNRKKFLRQIRTLAFARHFGFGFLCRLFYIYQHTNKYLYYIARGLLGFSRLVYASYSFVRIGPPEYKI